MRKITENVARAFFDGRKIRQGNTQILRFPDGGTHMYLHGNLIAHKLGNTLLITLAGWPTPTTRERLNGLLEIGGYEQGIWQETLRATKSREKRTVQWFGTLRNLREITEHEVIRLDLDD